MQFKQRIQAIWSQFFPPPPRENGDTLSNVPLPHGGPVTTKAAIDAYLEMLFADIATYAPAPVPSLIVTGTMRCGKTLVARRLARRNGMYHIPSDRLRHATYITSDEATKLRVIKYIYKRLLLAHPTGLVLDGTVFLDHGVTLPQWAVRRGMVCVAIGYSHDTPARKARHMIAFRKTHDCWTSGRKSDAELRRMARMIIGRSKDIKAQCAANGWPYFDLDSGQFHAENRRIVRRIERQLHAARSAP
ncbi:hypothetical protein [Roseinatronobacter sp. S2]|uniref:hypothetical protein n=1 Tax=Roseinatronobacter sp. S2 TaxID=3035471 RepID=UPI00240F14A8|nr:hypothetical protein [Roseinatronobacter sp. S2]WFE74844.1 hypothetical protein P8S53_00155 [Roseinatronobacter sp. S2]